MMLIDGIILGHYISAKGIQVDLAKIKVLLNFPTPSLKKQVHNLLVYAIYYCLFIQKISQIARPFLPLLSNILSFHGQKHANMRSTN
jgi:hypothetical protein